MYLGATVGRYANRIAQASITHEGRTWRLDAHPQPPHQLHGGPDGFHARTWEATRIGEHGLRLDLLSPDGDQGFPGELRVQVVYSLPDAMTIEMSATATVTAPCPVAITNHAYFNLDGDARDIRAHALHVAAAHYMPVDAELIPFGPPVPAQDTSFDFREAKTIQRDWLADAQQGLAAGYDHAFLLDRVCADLARPAAELTSSHGDLRLQIFTTLPALQLYTGQQLEPPCAGVALEPGFLPDSPNHPEWPQPTCWLLPGQTYRHVTRYVFTTSEAPGDRAASPS
jgi:aldose 1-epimerase